jgi:Probable lipid transfer
MAKSNTTSLLLVLLIASMLAVNRAADCANDVNLLRERCLQFVSASGPKVAPDSNCCAAVQKADIPCVCTYITPEVAKIISAEKLIYVSEVCGRPLKSGSKCGSMVFSLFY